MLKELVAALEKRVDDLTAEEIADILWLAYQQWQSESFDPPPREKPTLLTTIDQGASTNPPDSPPPGVSPPTSKSNTSQRSGMAGLTTNQGERPGQAKSAPTAPSAPLAIPDAPALRGSLEILRAIRSLVRQVPSAEARFLDVPATVKLIAETDLYLVQLQPVLEPWLELAIVVDSTASMVIWQNTIQNLRRVFAQSGIFRDVRMWSLDRLHSAPAKSAGAGGQASDQNGNSAGSQNGEPAETLCLRAGFGPAAATQPPCGPKELLDPNNRRLILVVSDCVDPRWDTQEIRDVLGVWANYGPMALVQVLPEWLWNRTALSQVSRGQFYSLVPGQPNQELRFVRRERWRQKTQTDVKVPVLTLDPGVVKRWSQMVAGRGSAAAPGLLFAPTAAVDSVAGAPAEPEQPSPDPATDRDLLDQTPRQRLEQFRTFSSPMARRLAGILAGCPEITLPIVRMVQAAMLPESQQVHVAEVLFGGLFKPQQVVTLETPPNEVQYGFYAGVQPLLQDTVPTPIIFQALSSWLSHRFNYSLQDFVANVTAERLSQVKPFAGVMLDVLKRRGRQYSDVIEAIAAQLRPQYASVLDLIEHETAEADYEIRTRRGQSGVAVLAIHGGNLQPGTTEIAAAIAGTAHSFYSFVSLKPEIDQTLYVPSRQFNDPAALDMVRDADVVLSIHGCAGLEEFIQIGGADRDRIEAIAPALMREGFDVRDDRSSGTHPENICNRGRTGRGVQLDLSRGLRNRLFDLEGQERDAGRLQQLVVALGAGVQDIPLPGAPKEAARASGKLTQSGFLVEAARAIGELADRATRERYARALADSLRIDESGRTPPQPASTRQIAEKHGISISDQVFYRISIKRKEIKDFLRSYGRNLRSSDVFRNFKTKAYEEYFQREISRGGAETQKSPTVYTYAELLQRMGFTTQIDLPDEVVELFRSLNISFPYENSESQEGSGSSGLQTLEFETAQFVAVESPELITFEVATLERQAEEQQQEPEGSLSRQEESQNEWIVRRQTRQGRMWVEPLGDRLQLELMEIPAGRFVMGSPEDELKRLPGEGPQHEVRVNAFWMGRYPVTQAQWRFVAGLEQVDRELNPEPSRFKGDKRPVERVNWDDAVEFCARLSRYTKREYRLPSEAEWEYACRAGTKTPFHFGETITTELANYSGSYTYGEGPNGEYRRETTEVDHFGVANAFGLCDMHGNVWEWCQDTWHHNYEGAPTDGSAWVTGGDNSYRVLRGGSWAYGPEFCRSAFRDYDVPGGIGSLIGFRVVCAPPGP